MTCVDLRQWQLAPGVSSEEDGDKLEDQEEEEASDDDDEEAEEFANDFLEIGTELELSLEEIIAPTAETREKVRSRMREVEEDIEREIMRRLGTTKNLEVVMQLRSMLRGETDDDVALEPLAQRMQHYIQQWELVKN